MSPNVGAKRMAGFIPQTHQRDVAGAPYTVVTSMHARGISIAVTVPGIGPEEEHNRSYMTEAEALGAADDIARILMQQCANLGSIN